MPVTVEEAALTELKSSPFGWRKSSRSLNGNCVEASVTDSVVSIRDSKDPTGAVLTFTADRWLGFLVSVRCGDFDC